MVGLPADKNWAENVYMPWPNFHPSFSESIFLLLAPYSVDLLQIGQRPCRLYPLAQSSSLFKCITCNRNTILLASCISFSSCSWCASSCSSQDFSSSCPSCPREGHNPQRATSSKSGRGTGEMRQGTFFFTASYLALQELMCSQPTCDRFLLCQLRFVILRFPLVLRVIMDCFFFRGVSELGDNILLFGGVSWAGWAETETDGGHRQEWMCLYAAKWAAIKKPNYIKWRFEILKIPRGAQ